jgi:hypothetical protein
VSTRAQITIKKQGNKCAVILFREIEAAGSGRLPLAQGYARVCAKARSPLDVKAHGFSKLQRAMSGTLIAVSNGRLSGERPARDD